MAGPISLFSKPSIFRTLALTCAAITGLSFVDTFLARTDRAETRVEAQRYYETGQRLMQQGDNDGATEQFRAAFAVDRDNQEYQLALAQALMAAGRYPDAEATLMALLQRDATGGAANLAMARVLVKEERIPEALSYYHRAVYGQWNQNALENRVRVRYELVDLLVAQNSTEGLLAELLPLQEEAPDGAETKMKLGRLFIAAGSPARGVPLFRSVLRTQPQDPDAYAGLGEAEFARGNYRTALAYFQTVSRFRPEDGLAQKRIAVTNQVLSLDPTARGLSIDEQYRRSLKVLDLELTDVRQCLSPAAASSSEGLMEAADKMLKQRVPVARQSAAYESNLELADRLWQVRKADCDASAHPSDEALSLVLNKLSQ